MERSCIIERGQEVEPPGEMREEPACRVMMHIGFGDIRVVDRLVGDPLARIGWVIRKGTSGGTRSPKGTSS